MKSMAAARLLITVILLPVLACAEEHSPLDAFPEPEQGMVRFVIPLPEMSRSDDNYAVELVVGRVIQTDGVNQVRMDTGLSPPAAGRVGLHLL